MPTEEKPVLRRHWHHDVQVKWGGRELYFVLLQFSQLYPQDEVLTDLKEIAADNGVSSYSSYEVMGEWDLLARLYVDPRFERQMEREIKDGLRQYGLNDQSWLRVKDVVRHWVWAPNGRQVGIPNAPDTADLARLWPRLELRRLNELETLNGRRPPFARPYVDANLVAFAKHQGGMKLAIAIQQRGAPADSFMYDEMEDRLAKVLDNAGSWIRERSLYAFGRRSETAFLVMCRLARNDDYHRIRFDLLQPVGDLVKRMNARVTTYPIVSSDLVCFTDNLPASTVEPSPLDVEGLLEGPETPTFEVKGSAFTPLDDFLKKGKPLSAGGELPSESDAFCVDTIGKEIVAFLNSGGGCLVVGALELSKFGKSDAIGDWPQNEHYAICGLVDETYQKRGWDTWERKLREVLLERIKPSMLNAVEIRPVTYMAMQLGLIVVDAAEPDYFFAPKKGPETFLIREGTSARKLTGADMERHRKRMRREVRRSRGRLEM
jgi:hypothetical protein